MPDSERDKYTGAPTRITGRSVSAQDSQRIARAFSRNQTPGALEMVPLSRLLVTPLSDGSFETQGDLKQISSGGEATVFESPEGSIYKIFRRHDDQSIGAEARLYRGSTPYITSADYSKSQREELSAYVERQKKALVSAQRELTKRTNELTKAQGGRDKATDEMQIQRGLQKRLIGGNIETQTDAFEKPQDKTGNLTFFLPEESRLEHTKRLARERMSARQQDLPSDDLFAWAQNHARQQQYLDLSTPYETNQPEQPSAGTKTSAPIQSAEPELSRSGQVAQAPEDRAISQAYERAYDLAQAIGAKAAKGQHANVIEAAQTAAWDNARRSIVQGGRFNPNYMTKSAMRAAGVKARRQPSSLNEPLGEEGEETHQDQLRAEGLTPDAHAAQNDAVMTSQRLLSGLDARDQAIVRGVTMEGRSMEDMANELGITKQRVSVLHSQALDSLRKRMNEHEANGHPVNFMPEEDMKTDNAAQEEWMNHEAQARGYASLDELLSDEPSAFTKMAAQWRVFHARDKQGLLLQNKAVSAINNTLYGRSKTDESEAGRGTAGARNALGDALAFIESGKRTGGQGTDDEVDAGKEQSARLAQWAQRNGLLIQKLPRKFDLASDDNKGGREHDVWHDEKTGRWVKVTRGTGESMGFTPVAIEDHWALTKATPAQYLQRIQNQNALFGDDIRLHAIWSDGKNVNIVTSQPDIEGEPATPSDISQAMKDAGFEQMDTGAFYRNTDNTAVFDLHEENAFKKNGALLPIDCIVVHPDYPLVEALRSERFSALAKGHAAFMPEETFRTRHEHPVSGKRITVTRRVNTGEFASVR